MLNLININYLSFAAPFIFFRANTLFRANEPLRARLIEGSIYAATATYVKYCVEGGSLKSYSYSYLPVIFSAVYNQNIFEGSNEIQLAGAAALTALTASAIQTGTVTGLIPAVTTYAFCNQNNYLKSVSFSLAAIAGMIDYSFSPENQHYASWAISGTAASYSLFQTYVPKGTTMLLSVSAPETIFAVGIIGATAGIIASNYESSLVEQIAAPSKFKEAYNSVANFIEPTKLNPMLESHFITMANLQIGIGFLGNFLLENAQNKDNLLVEIRPHDSIKFKNYIVFSIKYVGIALVYTASRSTSDATLAYHNGQLVAQIQKQMRHDHILRKDNFIHASKANFSVPSYNGDIETVIEDSCQIIQKYLFGIPKLSLIDKLTLVSYAGLTGVVIIDSGLNLFFQYLIKIKRSYAKQEKICDSQFEKTNEYDKQYAITIAQKNALNYTIDSWDELQQCSTSNDIAKSVISDILDASQGFYSQHVLYTALYVIVAEMRQKDLVAPAEIFLYVRILETLSNTILFKSKQQATFVNIGTSTAQLDELSKYLHSANNTINKVTYTVDESRDSLLIENLEFTRGTKEQTTHLTIENLELFKGNIYAITGANGSGKSSLATLLQFVLTKTADPSFSIKTGNITYPSSSLSMITQKDYIPMKVSLFDLVIYPNKQIYLSEQDQLRYATQMVKHINELKVFQHDITIDALYEVRDDWNELSGGQKKKLFLVKEFIECPSILVMDETFSPLDPSSRSMVIDEIKDSCLNKSIIIVVWHQDKNTDGTSCVVNTSFDYEIHIQNGEFLFGEVGTHCWQ